MKNKLLRVLMLTVMIAAAKKMQAQSDLPTMANWITIQDSIHRPVFEKNLSVDKPVRKAVLFITAHGLYEASLNGHKIGEAIFTPGFTSYLKRLQYQAYNVTKMLQTGKNRLRVTLAGGWYACQQQRGIIRRSSFLM